MMNKKTNVKKRMVIEVKTYSKGTIIKTAEKKKK